jgi:two-component system sensor histidine kinase SenX3
VGVPDVLTLIVVAALGLLVGAVGVGAFRVSERQIDREGTVQAPAEADADRLPAEVLAVLTAIPEIAIVVDADDTIARAGAAAYAKGLTRGDELAHEALVDLVRRVRDGGMPIEQELQVPRSPVRGAAVRDFDVRAAALPGGRVLVTAEDLTVRRRSEQTRRDFTANVSHELKTPVGAIQLLAETIADNPDDPEMIAHFAPKLRREAERLSVLIQDLIDLSRFQDPEALSTPVLVDIDDVVAAALARQETVAQSSGIELAGPRTPTGAQVWGNRDMLVTAVRNLLDNAVRYSDRGTRVSVGISVEDDLVNISVVDSGIGIPPADQDRIFERFYRVDPARSRNTGGTGLGLSIVKHVASDHGGTVTVWSRPGRGSTFTLVLPQAGEGDAAWSAARADGERTEEGNRT